MGQRIDLPNCTRSRARVDVLQTYTANTPFQIPLLRTKNHTVIRALAKINYDSTTGAVPTEDGIAKLVKGVAIQINLGPKLCEVQDLSQLVQYMQHLKRGRLEHDQPAASKTAEEARVELEFNLPLNFVEPFDASVAIPAQAAEISDIHLVGTWGTAADLGTGFTINSGSISVIDDFGWVCSEAGFRANFPPEERLMPNWYFGQQTFTGAVANFGQMLDLRPSVVVRNVFLIAKNAAGARNDSIVSEFALKLYDNSYILGPLTWAEYQARMADDLDMDKITGCILIDCTKFNKEFCYESGIQVEKTADIQVVYTTTAAGSVTWLFDAVLVRPGVI